MSRRQRVPMVAFVLVAACCFVLMATAASSDAVRSLLHRTVTVVAPAQQAVSLPDVALSAPVVASPAAPPTVDRAEPSASAAVPATPVRPRTADETRPARGRPAHHRGGRATTPGPVAQQRPARPVEADGQDGRKAAQASDKAERKAAKTRLKDDRKADKTRDKAERRADKARDKGSKDKGSKDKGPRGKGKQRGGR